MPENWCWVKLGTVITASKEKQDAFDSETKYVGLEHIEKDTGNISFAVADGVNQSNINAKKIGAFEFDVPTILEQQEIVRLLDNLLSSEQSTVTACEEALTTIDTLKKSILARAFRGELGTNDPSEASAKELLLECFCE